MTARLLLVAGLAALVLALLVWVPSRSAAGAVGGALLESMGGTGLVSVRARATALGMSRGVVGYVEVVATRVPLGDLVAARVRLTSRNLRLSRGQGGKVEVTGAEVVTAQVEIDPRDLEQLLLSKGVESPEVKVGKDGITAAGVIRMGPVNTTARLRGSVHEVGGTDLFFRIQSIEVGGVQLPPDVTRAAVALAGEPVLSLRDLPLPIAIERVAYGEGRLTIHAAGRSR